MSDTHEAIERSILEVLKAPERYENPIDTPLSPEDLLRTSMLDSYMLARRAWKEVRPMAVSYRGCHVITAARLLRVDPFSQATIDVGGYNFKPSAGSTPNIHSEEIILYQAQHLQAITLNLVVIGETQVDNDITGNDLVLAPCDYRCTPKIVTDASVGPFTMTTCVNPITGATQFIPHARLKTRDWSDIPCIEVEGLNDHTEWLEKASPIIDALIQTTDLQELEAFIERKRNDSIRALAEIAIALMPNPSDGHHFLASPSASVVQESTYSSPAKGDLEPQLVRPQLVIPRTAIHIVSQATDFSFD